MKTFWHFQLFSEKKLVLIVVQAQNEKKISMSSCFLKVLTEVMNISYFPKMIVL